MIIAAFCGTGKTHLAQRNSQIVEVECWKYYNTPEFPDNVIRDIESAHNMKGTVFISTNTQVVLPLLKRGHHVTLVYPDLSLKDEYMRRVKDRNSHPDFVRALDTYWMEWLQAAMKVDGCQHIVLKSGQFLEDVFDNDS